jgi:hypothetical protein
MPKKRLLEIAIKDRHHVKISLSWRNITLSKLFTIFLPNVYHMLKDLYLLEKKTSPLANLVRHASSTRKIVDKISSSLAIPRELLLLHRKEGACYVGLAEGHNPETHFAWLNKFVDIPFHSIPPKGYKPPFFLFRSCFLFLPIPLNFFPSFLLLLLLLTPSLLEVWKTCGTLANVPKRRLHLTFCI